MPSETVQCFGGWMVATKCMLPANLSFQLAHLRDCPACFGSLILMAHFLHLQNPSVGGGEMGGVSRLLRASSKDVLCVWPDKREAKKGLANNFGHRYNMYVRSRMETCCMPAIRLTQHSRQGADWWTLMVRQRHLDRA